jgi:hypothetical protein
MPRNNAGVDFAFEHAFAAAPDEVAAAILDRGYQASLVDLEPLAGREVLSQESTSNGLVVRRVRCVLGTDLGAARKFLGNSEPAWIEEATWHPEEMLWRWHVIPEVARELLDASGSMALEDSDGETIRRVEGTVRVKVPLFGQRVEGVVVDGLERAYEEEASRLAAWLG